MIRNTLREERDELRRIVARLQGEHPSEVCHWRQDAEWGQWETDCGQCWELIDGDPAENNCRFCHYCGRVIVAHPHAESEVDHD